jgi:1-deoxy-D-xylulose-5-phosphate synthase
MSVPNLTIFAPTYFDELSSMIYQAIYREKNAVAIRYPRGNQPPLVDGYKYVKDNFNIFGDSNAKRCIVTYGRLFHNCYCASQELDDTFVLKLNKIKPIDIGVIDALKNVESVYFYEEAVKSGSVGECFASLLIENNVNVKFEHICINDEFVKQASVLRQLEFYGMDKQSIVDHIGQKGNTNNV